MLRYPSLTHSYLPHYLLPKSRVIITKIDHELNELETKTHLAGVVGLNKFNSSLI